MEIIRFKGEIIPKAQYSNSTKDFLLQEFGMPQEDKLKKAVRESWSRISEAQFNTAHHPLLQAFAEHLDELDDSTWRIPRDRGGD